MALIDRAPDALIWRQRNTYFKQQRPINSRDITHVSLSNHFSLRYAVQEISFSRIILILSWNWCKQKIYWSLFYNICVLSLKSSHITAEFRQQAVIEKCDEVSFLSLKVATRCFFVCFFTGREQLSGWNQAQGRARAIHKHRAISHFCHPLPPLSSARGGQALIRSRLLLGTRPIDSITSSCQSTGRGTENQGAGK